MLQSGIRGRLNWFSLTPFDQSTQEGRAQERHRRMALSAAAAALAKLLSVGTALISVPLTLHYLGAERFGMWMTISSLIAMLGFADLGIANGVLSSVADAHGRDDRDEMRKVVSSGFFLLTGIAAILLTILSLSYFAVPWAKVFNVQGELASREAGPALAVFVCCFAAAIPLAVVQRVQIGLQQGFAVSLWQCAGSLLGLAGVLLVIRLQMGLPWLVLALAGVPLAATLLNSIHFYLSSHPELRPRLSLFSAPAARRVARTGALFFVLQATVALAYMSDSMVIAQTLGASAVASYAVPEKLFSLITIALGMLFGPLWPAYGEAMSRGDGAWVRRTLKNSMLLALGFGTALSVSLMLLSRGILQLWVGEALHVSAILLWGFASWKVVEAVGTAAAMFLNGAKVIRLQVACAIPTALVAVALKIWLVQRIGVAGAVWASVIAYLLFTALPVAWHLPQLVRRTRFAR